MAQSPLELKAEMISEALRVRVFLAVPTLVRLHVTESIIRREVDDVEGVDLALDDDEQSLRRRPRLRRLWRSQRRAERADRSGDLE